MESKVNACVSSYSPRETETDAYSQRERSEDMKAAYIDTIQLFERKHMEMFDEDLITMKVIYKVDEPYLRAILIDRYVNRMQWEEIAKHLHSSVRSVYRHRVKALEEVGKIIKVRFDDNEFITFTGRI